MFETIIQPHPPNAPKAWKGLFTLGTALFIGLAICVFSVICYGFLFFDYNTFSTSELVALLNSPSTLAFQILLINSAYIFSLIWLHYHYKLNYKNSLNLNKSSGSSLFLAILMILSASIIIDQALLSLSDGPLSSLPYTNLAGNLNLAYILGNLDGINLFSFSLLLFLTVVSSPVLEELFFRGYLWVGLRNKLGFFPTLFVSSFFFALIHLDVLQGLSAFCSGIVYGFIVEKSKSVWPAIVAHISLNLFTYFLSLKGMAYGVDGSSYPLYLILFCLTILIVGALIMQKESLQEVEKI